MRRSVGNDDQHTMGKRFRLGGGMGAWRWVLTVGWLALVTFLTPRASTWEAPPSPSACIAALHEPGAASTLCTEASQPGYSLVTVSPSASPVDLVHPRDTWITLHTLPRDLTACELSWRSVYLNLRRARAPPAGA